MFEAPKNIFRNPMLKFGKFKGRRVYDVLNSHPEYIVWAYNNVPNHGIPDTVFKLADDLVTKLKEYEYEARAEGDQQYIEYEPGILDEQHYL